MISRMNLVHEGARLAMADHRAAFPAIAAPRPRRSLGALAFALFSALLAKVTG